jgi:transglutaminase-like putative cysteine protease
MAKATYRVRHTTTYSYETLASMGYNLVSSKPRTTELQQVHFYRCLLEPDATSFQDYHDFFGNHCRYFTIEQEFKGLSMTSLSEVEVMQLELSQFTQSLSFDKARLLTESDRFVCESQFLYPSPLVQWSDQVSLYALQSTEGRITLLEVIRDLNSRIHRDFLYKPGSTELTSSVTDVFELKQGVCQDFAHFGVACCRSLGLCARYVSGYLLTTPPEGQEKLIGADASHAWFSVFFPDDTGGCWIDFDPTNNCMIGIQHICQAWGRDYGDVSPVRGVVLGGGLQSVHVAVDVTPLDEMNH